MEISIRKYYMITLDTSVRFNKYYKNSNIITSSVTKFSAIDSRNDFQLKCHEKGYRINLKPKYHKHFKRCKGAYGCTLSHASIYELIKDKPSHEYYCVLEDDVKPHFLENLIKNNNINIPDNALIIDLIDRTDGLSWEEAVEKTNMNLERLKRYREVNSTAGYLINSLGAQILLKELNKEITLPHDIFMYEHCQKKYPDIIHKIKLLERYIPENSRDPSQRDLL